MVVEIDRKDLAKYPFLKEARSLISSLEIPLDSLIKSSGQKAEEYRELALQRVLDSLFSSPSETVLLKGAEDEIVSYAIARMMVSCMDDRQMMDRLARFESERASHFLAYDRPEIRNYVAQSVGLVIAETMPVVDYVSLASSLRDDRWRLINRDVHKGEVMILPEDHNDFLRERIRGVIRSQLPLQVPAAYALRLKGYTDRITGAYREHIFEQFGEIDEGSYPPCMMAIIDAVSEGTNIPHTARFALTAFLHTIGMDESMIIEVFTRAPDFDVERTLYQVEHISGRGGTEYTPPSCGTMRTYGLCVKRNALCAQISHPLSYYKAQKKKKN